MYLLTHLVFLSGFDRLDLLFFIIFGENFYSLICVAMQDFQKAWLPMEVYKWSTGYSCFLFLAYYHTYTDLKFLFLIRYLFLFSFPFFPSWYRDESEWTGSRFFPTALLLVSPFALRFDIVVRGLPQSCRKRGMRFGISALA